MPPSRVGKSRGFEQVGLYHLINNGAVKRSILFLPVYPFMSDLEPVENLWKTSRNIYNYIFVSRRGYSKRVLRDDASQFQLVFKTIMKTITKAEIS
ncbi:unnamed protein product [Dracunculus medinensis]|uniref:DDE_3 domain-containing protein n=1 Tax=Dracunculus medinensis TaxID=318479 RepID=A0A0N4URH4_DRAME|nr:unnamed protein product [Dracunculus medinensis]